jgi:hypothetical protein
MGWVVSTTPRPLYPRAVPTVQEAGWESETVWTGAENLTSTGIRSPDHQKNKSTTKLQASQNQKYVLSR